MQNILTNICNLCCCKHHHTHWPDDIRHTRSCWNRNECHEIIPSMRVHQKLVTTGENVTGTQNTFPPLFNIKFTQHILCNYFMHSCLQCRCKSSCTQTAWGSDPEGGWRSQRPHCARWARTLLTVQSWGSEKAARRTCKQTQRGAHIQSADWTVSRVPEQRFLRAAAAAVHKHRASKMQIHCIICRRRFRIMQRIFQKMPIRRFLFPPTGWLISRFSCRLPPEDYKAKTTWLNCKKDHPPSEVS